MQEAAQFRGEAIGHKGVAESGSPEAFFTPLTCSLSTEGPGGRAILRKALRGLRPLKDQS